MASAQGLLGLMTQLHNLESNVASILLEASLKLCSLTDINIFFLVETAGGRRFAGNPKFCDQFRQEGLLVAETDVECVVNPAISGLEERVVETSRAGLPTRPRLAPDVRNGFTSSTPFRSLNRKRTLPLNETQRSSKAFKRSTHKSDDNGHNAGDDESAIGASDVDGDLIIDHFDNDEGREALSIDLKQENPADATANSGHEFDLTDDDIVEVPLSDRMSRPFVDDVAVSASNANETFSDWQMTSTFSVSQRTPPQSQPPPNPGQPVMDFVNDIYPQSLLDKLNALDSFEVDVIFEPSAAPRKVLNSILHEVGTKLASSCPYWPRHLSNPQLKEFLISNIEVFIGKFPVMQRICNDKHKVYIGKKAMSKLTYVKNNIRSSYDKQFKGSPKEVDFAQVLA